MAENPLADGLALPVGYDLAGVGFDVFCGDRVALLIPVIQYLEVIDAVTGQLRKSRHHFGCRATFADDQLIVTKIEGLLLTMVQEIQCAQHRHRVFTVILLIERRFVQRPFDRQTRLGLDT